MTQRSTLIPAQAQEKSACGVGFVANLKAEFSHQTLQKTLYALACQEHRGACSADGLTGDGAGVMTDIPYELLGYQKGTIAVANLFAPANTEQRRRALGVLEQTFDFLGLSVIAYREVPTNPAVLGTDALARLPYMVQAIIRRPEHCRTNASFDKLLYTAKQYTRTKLRQKGIEEVFFCSLSANTIVYKGLTTAADLPRFYLDLQNPQYLTRFGMFHRRFSTNTVSSWDKAQPFRMIAHNGEFNTINGNRAWAVARERTLGLYKGELLTEEGISDSGSLNEMFEALKYRSGIPYLREIMAILMPPANSQHPFYEFWSRTMEPWDGPALVLYANGRSIGARLDRNGFRPCRWARTADAFYLASEAGSFALDEAEILEKGSLQAGTGINLDLRTGELNFTDPGQSRENYDAKFDKRTFTLPYLNINTPTSFAQEHLFVFQYTEEELSKILTPMIAERKEPIGSMGDTARIAIFSDQPRSLFDYFYHNFAQVTNPPLDYLRERNVTDLTCYLGRQPNIFAKKELLPPPVAFALPSPVMSLGQMEQIAQLSLRTEDQTRILVKTLDITFERNLGTVAFEATLEKLAQEAAEAVDQGYQILVLSDESASFERLPLPAMLALRAVITRLRDEGLRLRTSILMHTGQARTTHQVATLIGMGAAAVCPYLALQWARHNDDKKLQKISPDEREQNLVYVYEQGLLKIMSKMGISTVRSYQNSQLFTAIGISFALIERYFNGVSAYLSGIDLPQIAQNLLQQACLAEEAAAEGKMLNTYSFKEHNKGEKGEKHAMTNTRSKIIHDLVRSTGIGLDQPELYQTYLSQGIEAAPVSVRHLFDVRPDASHPAPTDYQSVASILRTFGAGAMSFGALSAESQRDIFLAMQEIGGRSNSGEGGENPYYYSEGLSATTKQIASGRFGVNALYLVSGQEVQIKIAQGAKPGEGGQLMGLKVNADIARARFASEGVDLISPPPMHDIYSIEDLRELIYEIKQLKPGIKVNVKLVSGANIGTIAVGVAKAGADIIHVSGGDGGTGAAALSSMKHAGLPWEFGLWEVHQALTQNGLRRRVELRVDGGLHSGDDLIKAAILGAEGFEFGKLLLVAQGCVMARICEKNTCPTGIATHDPRFKAKYKGSKDHIVKMLEYLADDVQHHLKRLQVSDLRQLIGRTDLLIPAEGHLPLLQEKQLSLDFFLAAPCPYPDDNSEAAAVPTDVSPNALNAQILADALEAVAMQADVSLHYPIQVTERAAWATLCGAIALREHQQIQSKFDESIPAIEPYRGRIRLRFEGSAGQGFGIFNVPQIEARLYGEANDSVCKGMSGGRVVINPSAKAGFAPEENIIIGNVALYGATGGTLYVHGLAGDRFAVRNSGATAVVEGVGLHACEYMTGGRIFILGNTSHNIGGGMTGGDVILLGEKEAFVNQEYLARTTIDADTERELHALLEDYYEATGSQRARYLLNTWAHTVKKLRRYVPKSKALKPEMVATELV
ncbi:glutamate synthase large subunit [Eisenibacter elegans]|uniref:glutamate synthase large subunit n=1 Tax=Eisenibacter elegans TaxID=997 RepID=UPI000406D046|nr:glutamate synthase large subunit [Eisenibacter elegans]